MFLNLSFFGHFKNSRYSEKSGSGFELQHIIFQPNRRWNGHKGFCQFCGRPTISAANTDTFDLKLVFVPR